MNVFISNQFHTCHHCLNYCSELPYGDYNSCLNSCGSPTFAQKEIVYYQFQYIASWARIPFHPWDFTGNYQTITSQVIFSTTINLTSWTVPNPWPNVVSNSNTCYAIVLNILYSDSTTCQFIGELCHIIG